MRLNAVLNPHQASRMATTCMQAKSPASIQFSQLDAIISTGHLRLTRRGGKRAFIPKRQIYTALAAPSTLVASNVSKSNTESPKLFSIFHCTFTTFWCWCKNVYLVQAEPKTLELPSSFQGHITYQVVDSIDYEEVSKLLEKVSQ